jgi:hypothetical protein
MVKTTVYLPEDLKAAISRVAAENATSEAEIIREALRDRVHRDSTGLPLVPLFPEGLGDETVAERVDELLHGSDDSLHRSVGHLARKQQEASMRVRVVTSTRRPAS